MFVLRTLKFYSPTRKEFKLFQIKRRTTNFSSASFSSTNQCENSSNSNTFGSAQKTPDDFGEIFADCEHCAMFFSPLPVSQFQAKNHFDFSLSSTNQISRKPVGYIFEHWAKRKEKWNFGFSWILFCWMILRSSKDKAGRKEKQIDWKSFRRTKIKNLCFCFVIFVQDRHWPWKWFSIIFLINWKCKHN